MAYPESNDTTVPLPAFPSVYGQMSSGKSPYSSDAAYAYYGTGNVPSYTKGNTSTAMQSYESLPTRQCMEKVVEVPRVFYKQVPTEKVVEVPQVQTQIVVKEVVVPAKYEVPIVQPRQIPVEQKIERNVPVPVDVCTKLKFVMPQLIPKYTTVKERIVVPRYVEIPVPTHLVQVEDFDQSMVPGPPIKDYVWPQNAIENNPDGVFQQQLDQLTVVNGESITETQPSLPISP